MSNISRLNMKLQEDAEELGFSSVQEALDAGYEVVGDKLYMSVEQFIFNEKETQLNLLDEVIGYLKGIEADNEDMLADMIDNLRTVERYIKEN